MGFSFIISKVRWYIKKRPLLELVLSVKVKMIVINITINDIGTNRFGEKVIANDIIMQIHANLELDSIVVITNNTRNKIDNCLW